MEQRGLTPVLGLVLLVGITAIASMALLFFGMSLADTTQSSAEYEQAEQSMAQLAESGDRISDGEARRAAFSIRGSNAGQVRAVSDAGMINVTVTNRSTGTHLMTVERSLGAVVYEAADGTEVAYQGGGVWRREPSGHSSLVRSPEFHYRANPEDTITFPIMLVRDDFTTSGDTTGQMVARTSERHYPDRSRHLNPLTNGSVLITVDSKYCQGWEQYFEGRTDGSAAEDCDDGEQGELVIQFSVPFELNGLDSGVMLGEGYSDSQLDENFDIDPDNVTQSADPPSATPMVEGHLEDARDSGNVLPDEAVIDDEGLYYDDGNLSNGDIEFDTSNGDIEIASDEEILFDDSQDVDITGDGNVTIYTRGDLVDNGGGGEIGTPGNSSQLRIFFHSDVNPVGAQGQNTDFYGLLYAPNARVELFRGRGSNDAEGAIVADTYDFGNNFEMRINEELANMEFYEQLGDAPFYYLHISETEVHVERD